MSSILTYFSYERVGGGEGRREEGGGRREEGRGRREEGEQGVVFPFCARQEHCDKSVGLDSARVSKSHLLLLLYLVERDDTISS